MFIFRAKFLQSVSTTPKSKMFRKRLAARRAESNIEDNAAPEMRTRCPEVPAIADLTTAEPEAVDESHETAASTPATKVNKREKKRKSEACDDSSRVRASGKKSGTRRRKTSPGAASTEPEKIA